MNAKEAAALALKNQDKTPDSKEYREIMAKIESEASKGSRKYTAICLCSITVSRLIKDGYAVEQGSGSDPRDSMCFTISW